MEHEIEKKIKDLKEFIKQKTDQGTANYLGKELRELCGIVEMEALRIHNVSNNEVVLKAFVEEFVEAWEDGMGGDTDLYRKAKSLL